MLSGSTPSSRRGLVLLGGAALLLSGCASAQRADVEEVATAFADPSGDPEARCDLLAPATLRSFEESESAPCTSRSVAPRAWA